MTNYFRGLPVPAELKRALESEILAEDNTENITVSNSVRRVTESDGVPGTGPFTGILLYETLESDYGNVVWLEDEGNIGVYKFAHLPTCSIGTRIRYINMPAPDVDPGTDAFVYVGIEGFGSGRLVYQGEAIEGPPYLQILTGNGVMCTHVSDDDGPVWEIVADEPISLGGPTPPAAHASSHYPDGSDPLDMLAFEPTPPYSVSYPSNSRVCAGAVGEMRGHADGFNVTVVVRIDSVPASGLQSIFGNWRPFQPDGGWYVGVDNNRWTFGLGQQSDGQVIGFTAPGPADLDYFRGGRLPRWHVIQMMYDGTTGHLLVDGELVASLTPSGGYQVSDAGMRPYVGQTNSVSDPMYAENCHVAYWQYGESAEFWNNPNVSALSSNALTAIQFRSPQFSRSVGDSQYTVPSGTPFEVTDATGGRSAFSWNFGTVSFANVWN